MLTNFVKINRCNGWCQFQIQHMLISTSRLGLFQKIMNYFGKNGGFGRLNPQHARKVWGDKKDFYLRNRAYFSDVGTVSNGCLGSGLSPSTMYTTLLKNAELMFYIDPIQEVTGESSDETEPLKDKPYQPEPSKDAPNQPEPPKDKPNQPEPESIDNPDDDGFFDSNVD